MDSSIFSAIVHTQIPRNELFVVTFSFVIGCCYATDVLSTHHVESLNYCGQLSLAQEKCVGFRFRSANDNQANCESFQNMENCSKCETSNGDWKYYKSFNKEVSVNW